MLQLLLYALRLNHQLNQEVELDETALVFQDDFLDFITWSKKKADYKYILVNISYLFRVSNIFRVCFVF